MRAMKQRAVAIVTLMSTVFLVVLVPRASRAQAQIEPEAQVWVNRLVKQMTDLKTIWGRFLLEEDRNYKDPPTPPDPNKRVNVQRQSGWSVSEVFWVYDGFRERYDSKQIEPKEPRPGEFAYDTRRFFNGEILVDQVGHSVSLRDDDSVLDWTPRRFFLTVVNRPYTQAIREAQAIRAINPEVKFGVEVAGFEMDLEKPGPFRVRVYLETEEPHLLRGHEEFRDGDLGRTRWIDAYNPEARNAGLLCPQEAHIDTHYNNVRYTLRTQEVHVNEAVPAEHWQMRFSQGDSIVDEMTGNQWDVADRLPDELDRRINQTVDMKMIRGEVFERARKERGQEVATPERTSTPAAKPETSRFGLFEITIISVASAFGIGLFGFGLWQALFTKR